MTRNLWVGVLTLLNALVFGLIVAVGQPKAESPAAPSLAATTGPARPVAAAADAPSLSLPDWPAESGPAAPRAASRQTSPVTAADLSPVASLELTAEFEESVRKARAAGIDEVLLAHAVVAQFHRQSEAILQGADQIELTNAQREQARAETVVGLLGETAWRGWQRSDYLLSHGLAGTGITDAELDTLLLLNAERDKRLAELWQSGRTAAANHRLSTQQIQDDYRRRLDRALGADRVRQLGF